MPKITIIGAGAYVFPLKIIGDIVSYPALRDAVICMYDIDEVRNRRNAQAVRRIFEIARLPTRLEATTDRQAALRDADFCICVFQVGGIEAYGLDVMLPRRYGIDQCVGDSFGPGGIFRGLRSIKALREIALDIRQLCPDTLFIQYANPMAINCWAMSRFGIANIGLCHSVQGTSKMLAGEMGLAYEDCSFISASLNHQAWFVDFRYRGTDVMPHLRKSMIDRHLLGNARGDEADELHAGRSERVRTEIMQLTGYFHTESSAHASEYLAYFRKNPDLVREYQPERWDYYEICCAHDSGEQIERLVADVQQHGITRSDEYGAGIIDSMTTGALRLVHGSVPNENIISNLPAECSVEVPVCVDRQGLRPQVIGALPVPCAAVSRLLVNQVQLAVEAALTGDRDLVYAAVALDPLTAAVLTLPQIRRMVDELIAAQEPWLPSFESKTVLGA